MIITTPEYSFISKAGSHTGNGVALIDIESAAFEYVNEQFLKLFAVEKRDGFTPRQLLEKVHEEDIDYLKKCFEKLAGNRFIDEVEFRICDSNQVRHLSCYFAMLENQLLTAFVKDITEQKHHEDYLVKFSAQKDTMLDMLTHNLSGSLELSRGLISSLEKTVNGSCSAARKHLEMIRENTQQCIEIVNEFLRVEHSESITTEVHNVRFDIIEKTRNVIEKMQELNPDKILRFIYRQSNVYINSDAVKYFQVIHNIISNSIKFTGQGGKIEISIIGDTDRAIIKIEDNGIGIPDILRPMIFKGRVMGRAGLKGERSSGLGLSIAHRLVSLMKGRMWFESEENKGSVFYVELPKN